MFGEPVTSLGGPADPVVRPVGTAQLDHACETAVVIGRGGGGIRPAVALARGTPAREAFICRREVEPTRPLRRPRGVVGHG
ncbi:hypothetical protein [Streptomyces sp. Ag109_O5-10]|uniref:hypothetical protein n=1 Tax=Streptomyces sp. Ag109_O5-10 TaxID=1855349 RepID=UPI0035255285